MPSYNLKPCPYCEGNSDVILIETNTRNFALGQAFECSECGLRSMSTETNDDEMTVKIWNDMSNAIWYAEHPANRRYH